MYSLAWLGLLTALLVAPALAVAPRLIFSARTAIALPILSCLILYIFKEIFYLLSIYTTTYFRVFILALCAVAALRVYLASKTCVLQWSEKEILCYAGNFIILMPLLLWFWATPYDAGADAISSWEFWAQHHYLGLRPDFFYTVSPYPQAFPVFISNIYTLWGSAEYHSLARSLFFVFPYCLLTALSLVFSENSSSRYGALLFSLVMYLLFFFAGFKLACADPMMAAALTLSVFYTLYWQRDGKQEYLYFSAACALLAIFAKQHAVTWTCFAWPLVLLVSCRDKQQRQTCLLCIGLVLLAFALWLVAEGRLTDVFYNKPALRQSFTYRGWMEQLGYGLKIAFGLYPGTLILLALCLWVAATQKTYLFLVVCFIIPALGLWVYLGNYSVSRSGMHVIAVMGLVAASRWPDIKHRFSRGQVANRQSTEVIPLPKPLLAKGGIVLMLVFIAAFHVADLMRRYPLDAGHRSTLFEYYDDNADNIRRTYDAPNTRFLTHSAVINSVMLRRARIIHPLAESNEMELLRLIRDSEIQVLLPFPSWYEQSPSAIAITNLGWFCNDLFEEVDANSAFAIRIIRRDRIEACRQALLTRKFFISPESSTLY